ncbi:hypothetical protein KSP40_PGU007836 [Platanthera guangdongensis]|uniref:Uncharacterized protein n=1 Tax=Platanthera guangdongensis TaxID=2320717 RepID=A0ABR2MWE4_9ASPA
MTEDALHQDLLDNVIAVYTPFGLGGRDRSRRGDYYSPPKSRTPPGDNGEYKALKRSLSPETNVRHLSRSRSYR